MATVWVPGPLKELTGGRETVSASGATVKEVVDDLDRSYPGFKAAIIQEGLLLRPGIAVAVDGNVVKKGLLHPVNADSEVFFVPAIGGG